MNEKRKKSCLSVVEKFLKTSPKSLHPVIIEMDSYIPEFTSTIISKIHNKVINYMSMGNTPHEVLGDIFDTILLMLQKINQNDPETDPFATSSLFSDREFLTGLFMHAGLNEEGKFDHRVIDIIYKYLLVKIPTAIQDLLLESKESIFSLMYAIAREDIKHETNETSKIQDKFNEDDKNASKLFNQLFVCNPKITSSLLPDVLPLVKKFPTQLVIDLMIACKEVKAIWSEGEFEAWLIEREDFSLSDVDQIFKFEQELWLTILPMQLILKTAPPTNVAFVGWIHSMPRRDLTNPEDLTKDTISQIFEPNYLFVTLDDDHNTMKSQKKPIGAFDTRDLYLYSRLFVLAHSNPLHVDPKYYDEICKLVFEKSEYVSAAAIQVISIWIAHFDFQADFQQLTYRLAEMISIPDNINSDSINNTNSNNSKSNNFSNRKRGKAFKTLLKVFLHVLSIKNKAAEMILRTDQEIRFDPHDWRLVALSPWEFTIFAPLIETIPLYDKDDQKNMLLILNNISEYLGFHEEEEEEEEDFA